MSKEEIEDVILQSYTGNPDLEKDFPIDRVRSGFINMEGVIYNYRTVRRATINNKNNSYFFFEIDGK